MRTFTTVTLRSSFVWAAALALTGCVRGCDLGPPAEPCERTDECAAPSQCYRGYCSSPEYIEDDRSCRAAPGCRELGACGAVTVRSFLGLDRSVECLAVDAADCRAAQVCAEQGRCSLGNGVCEASSDADCAASRRCTTHDECALEGSGCVRRLSACEPPRLPAGAPAWVSGPGEENVFDVRQFGGPWQPGALEAGVVACRFELARLGDSRVQLGEQCFAGPHFGRGGGVASFVRAGVRLRPGDEVFAASHGDRTVGTVDDSYVKARYTGASPLQGGAGRERLECHVVPPEVARPIGLAVLPVVDAAIAEAMPRPTDDHRSAPRPLDQAQRATREAAAWLGWDDPEIVARVQQIAGLGEAHARAVAATLTRRRKKATAPRGLLVFDNEIGLRVLGHVCGAQLDARRTAGARRTTDATRCGVELRLENRGILPLSLDADQRSVGNLEALQWLQVTGGLATAVDAELIDVRPATAGAVPGRSATLEPGGAVVILLAGAGEDIDPARDAPGEFTLLSGRVHLGSEFLLRTELGAAKPSARDRRRK